MVRGWRSRGTPHAWDLSSFHPENIGQAKFEGSLCSTGLQLRGQQSRRSRPHLSGESISGQSPPALVDLSSTSSLVPALWQLERLKRAVTGALQDLQPVQGCWNIEDAAAGLAEELPWWVLLLKQDSKNRKLQRSFQQDRKKKSPCTHDFSIEMHLSGAMKPTLH